MGLLEAIVGLWALPKPCFQGFLGREVMMIEEQLWALYKQCFQGFVGRDLTVMGAQLWAKGNNDCKALQGL